MPCSRAVPSVCVPVRRLLVVDGISLEAYPQPWHSCTCSASSWLDGWTRKGGGAAGRGVTSGALKLLLSYKKQKNPKCCPKRDTRSDHDVFYAVSLQLTRPHCTSSTLAYYASSPSARRSTPSCAAGGVGGQLGGGGSSVPPLLQTRPTSMGQRWAGHTSSRWHGPGVVRVVAACTS